MLRLLTSRIQDSLCRAALFFAAIAIGSLAHAANDADFFSHNVPSAAAVDTTIDVQLNIRNTGSTMWTAADSYSLAVMSDPCGLWPHFPRIFFPDSYSAEPGKLVRFFFDLELPSTAGPCAITFQMVQENVEFFGDPVTIIIELQGDILSVHQKLTPQSPAGMGLFGGNILTHNDRLYVTSQSRVAVYSIAEIMSGAGPEPADGFLFEIAAPEEDDTSFGLLLDASDRLLAIGAPKRNNFGAVHLYALEINEQDDPVATIDNPVNSYDGFGRAAEFLSNGVLAVGYPLYSDPDLWTGAVFLFDGNPQSPTFTEQLLLINNPTSESSDEFGDVLESIETNLIVASESGVHGFNADPSSADFGDLLYSIDVDISSANDIQIIPAGDTFWLKENSDELNKYDANNGALIGSIDLPHQSIRLFQRNDQLFAFDRTTFNILRLFENDPARISFVLRDSLLPEAVPYEPFGLGFRLENSDGLLAISNPIESLPNADFAGSVYVINLPETNAVFHWSQYR